MERLRQVIFVFIFAVGALKFSCAEYEFDKDFYELLQSLPHFDADWNEIRPDKAWEVSNGQEDDLITPADEPVEEFELNPSRGKDEDFLKPEDEFKMESIHEQENDLIRPQNEMDADFAVKPIHEQEDDFVKPLDTMHDGFELKPSTEQIRQSIVEQVDRPESQCSGHFRTTLDSRLVKIHNSCRGKSDCIGILVKGNVVATSAHCVFDEPPLRGTITPVKCKECLTIRRIGNDDSNYGISYPMRHKGYMEETGAALVGMYRYDLAFVVLEQTIDVKSTKCFSTGCLDSAKKTKCHVYRIDGEEIRTEQVNLSHCEEVNRYGCDSDTFCATRLERNSTEFRKGESGSPVVCEQVEGNGKVFFHIHSLLSQKNITSKEGVTTRVNKKMARNTKFLCAK